MHLDLHSVLEERDMRYLQLLELELVLHSMEQLVASEHCGLERCELVH